MIMPVNFNWTLYHPKLISTNHLLADHSDGYCTYSKEMLILMCGKNG